MNNVLPQGMFPGNVPHLFLRRLEHRLQGMVLAGHLGQLEGPVGEEEGEGTTS